MLRNKCYTFYGLADKTRSIVLQKFFCFLGFFFFFFLVCEKSWFSEVEIFFSRFVAKNLLDTLAFFFWYFCKFWSKKYLPASLWNRLSSVKFYNYEPICMKFQKIFSKLRVNIVLIFDNDICYHHLGAAPPKNFFLLQNFTDRYLWQL